MMKTELRKIYLEKQKALSNAERAEKSSQIVQRFFEFFDLKNVELLHVFLSIEKKREIDTAVFIKRLRSDFPEIKTATSRLDYETMTLEHLKFSDATEIVVNGWQIPEPKSGETIEIEKIDAVLVPLLCFDRRGFRVGYGKGFYDKFLGVCRKDCLKIGLSYFEPAAKISDIQPFDVRLDFCVTPAAVFNFSE